jgi:transposase
MSAKGLNVKRTWGSAEKIDNLIKKEKNARRKERLQGVLWRLENKDYTEIAKRLKRSIDTVREWVKRWNKLGYEGLIDKPKSGRPTVLGENEAKEIIDELNVKEIQSRTTCKTVIEKIKEKFNKKMSREAVRVMLRKNNISWKKPDKVDYRRNEEQRKLFLDEFSKKNL